MSLRIEDYASFVGIDVIDRIKRKAETLQNLRVTNINSTYYGGGVAMILSHLSLLMNSLGIRTGWRVIQGNQKFFDVTKGMHNALQGEEIDFDEQALRTYEHIIRINAIRNFLDHDVVIIHDPQPLPLIEHYKERKNWIWRCHIDLSSPNINLWKYLSNFVNKYEAMIVSSEEYIRRDINVPQLVFMPAIDPFSPVNREMDNTEITFLLDKYDIPTDLPIIAQISRFDKWKDPKGIIDVFNKVKKKVACRLVLLGNAADDDPEGKIIYGSVQRYRSDEIIIINKEDADLVNALQRKAAVILQKSIKEGFGLTVTEAMWKGTPVIGSNVGGIRLQIKHGINGFLVTTKGGAAYRTVQVLKDKARRDQLGRNARKTVRENFLITRLLEQYIDLFNLLCNNGYIKEKK